jgi:two-component system NarL family response regulator
MSCCWIQHLRQEVPDIKIVAITVYDHLISRAGEAGADLAIGKDVRRDELHNHIRQVYRSRSLPPAPRAAVPEEALLELLSERERQVLVLLEQGLSDRQIAEQLVIAENTAKNHVSNILSKLGAKNRTHAVKLARERGVLK